jgi:hypothetical protein
MEPAQIAPLTPEQLAAITAGGGFAQCEDPTNHMQYQLIQVEPIALDDHYFREKIEESYKDPRPPEPLNMAEIKAELRRRLAAKQKSDIDNGAG